VLVGNVVEHADGLGLARRGGPDDQSPERLAVARPGGHADGEGEQKVVVAGVEVQVAAQHVEQVRDLPAVPGRDHWLGLVAVEAPGGR
jgi:hypothetical protein